ncbi:MAG: Mammalian cell entry related domain protein [Caulobacteraceae bacterium]|jgi:phospholipid/cholesterol/gamma-HCH transport system substrate-binding protein|nr:Mammalian cell entry related domain protein [Caulobacteraceae bacterium]
MERNANYAMVGFASLVLFVGMAAFVLWLSQVRFAREYDVYDIVFDGPVRGISQGGEVHFNGIKVGEVTRIALDPVNASRVIARIKVTSDVPIRTDSYATLEAQGITGVNYVQITAGTRTRQLLKAVTPRGQVPVIRSQKSALADLLEGGGTVLQRSVEALDRVNRLLSDSNLKTVTGMVEDIHSVTGELRERRAIITDAQHALQSMDITLQKVGQLSDSTRGLVDGDAKRTLENLASAADDLKQTSHKAQEMLSKLDGPTTDFATNGLPQLTATIGSLQTATESINRVLNEAELSPGALISKPPAREIEVKP